jgi:hypothetical protein
MRPGNEGPGYGMYGNGGQAASARPPAGPRDGSRQRSPYEPVPYLDVAQGPRDGGDHRRAEYPPDRYQEAEQTQMFSPPEDDAGSRPRTGGGRHSRGPADEPPASYPYPEPTGEHPYNQGYGNGRR